MGYKLLEQMIALGRRSFSELREMADVYHSAGKLTDVEYLKILGEIEEQEAQVMLSLPDEETA